ncbi:sigma-54 dependent transcriptional regulator [uncultured Desulfosarcina sp.]|uniref:sigma-54-dependent transcriptional regulator n=1 Tax=uncultured Desulfosarcina sp. TaxID=218289 RepID=UPI0029C89170|nr:sigma-54 dependent transcriptional regulator [uncultured Desulfosarcina sp.]
MMETEDRPILIIDDEPSICAGCRMALADSGYSADICNTGRSGLEALLSGRYQLVLLDMKLPDMDGMDILQKVNDARIDICVIVMTGYASVKNAVDAMKLGTFDYLAKPFSDDELLAAVALAVENRRFKEAHLAVRRQLPSREDFGSIIGENPRILQLFDDVRKVAPTDTTVLLNGESGTGKELFAREIHAHSNRADHPFMAVDCSTFSSSLLESELFGHIKGAFTGAVQDKDGIFSAASHGTLFLDEVANLTLDIQAALLRAIETHEFKPVGTSRLKKADVRFIAATNRDLETMVDQGTFREDLFYRLNVFPITLPPLRERRDDIPRLLYHFLRQTCRETGKRVDGFSDDSLEMLVNDDWPGNVRQLKNVVARLVIIADSPVLECQHLSDHWETQPEPTRDEVPENLEALKAAKQNLLENQFGDIEKAFLKKALSEASGNITQAARNVGMQRSNFSTLMKKHGFGGTSGPSFP